MARQLSNWINAYLELMQDQEPPIKFLQWSAISMVAGACQRKVKLRWGGKTLYPNLYVLLVSPPGQARKGTAVDPIKDLGEMVGLIMAADSSTREQLIVRLNQCTCSIEKLDGGLELHSSMTVIAPEFNVFLGKGDERFMMDLTNWYDCQNKWVNETKNMGIDEVQGVFVNILGATTPNLIQSTLPKTAAGGGLTSRIIFVYERHARFRFSGRDAFCDSPAGLKLKEKMVHDLAEICNLAGQFDATPEFTELYETWYNTMPQDCDFDARNFQPYWSRRQTHLRKLAMILSAARSDNLVLEEQDFISALKILTETEARMKYAFENVGMDKNAPLFPMIMQFIAKRKEVTFGELMSAVLGDISEFELRKLVTTMETVKFCKTTETTGGMRITYIPKEERDGMEAN